MASGPDDKNRVMFAVQAFIGIAFMAFCGYGVMTTHNTEWKTIYWAGLSGMVGIWIPAPNDRH